MNYFIPCPICKNDNCDNLATTNEWAGYCKKCDIRFNKHGIIRPEDRNKNDICR